MMEIIRALKTDDIRLTNDSEHKWLVWDDLMGWNVYQHKPYARETSCLYAGDNLEDALDILIESKQEE